SAVVDNGTSVVVHATPAAGYRLGTWSGCATLGADCSFNAATTVSQAFVATYDVTVTPRVGGIVNATTPRGTPACAGTPTQCTVNVDVGTSVALTATAFTGYRVGTWSGCTGTGAACTVTTTATVANAFVAQFVLSTGVTSGSGGITSSDQRVNCRSAGCAT